MLKMIGYWIRSFDDRDFIAPQELVGEYPAHVRARIIEYLNGGRLLESYLGLGTCRFPSCEYAESGVGSREFTDLVWAWPQGLFHYIVKHNVTLPAEFVAHAMETQITPRTCDYCVSEYIKGPPDSTFWIDWCARNDSGVVRRKIAGLREEANQALVIRQGLSSERCHWKHCESPALNGKAYCVRHCEEDGMEDRLRLTQSVILRKFLVRCLADTTP